jgi:exosortase
MNESPKPEVQSSFLQDAAACWRRLPNKIFFFALLACWLALFQFLGNSILGYVKTPSLFVWLFGSLSNPNPTADDGIGHWIPFLVIGLFWWKRKQLLALPLQVWWPGLLILTVGALLHLTGFITQQPRFSVVGLFVGIFGLMGIAWGRAWLKEGFFPYWLFIFSVPMAAVILPLTFQLRVLSAWLTTAVANLLTIPVVRAGTQLTAADGSFGYDVAAACSGIRSLTAIFLLATIYGYIVFRSPGKRILLMALAFPLSVIGNFARLMCIILAAEFGGQTAGNFVHENSFFSLVPYIPAIGCLILIGRWLAEKKPAAEQPAEPATT